MLQLELWSGGSSAQDCRSAPPFEYTLPQHLTSLASLRGLSVQGDVHALDFEDGSATGWVLKAARNRVFASLMPSMIREWAVGQELIRALELDTDSRVSLRRLKEMESPKGTPKSGLSGVPSCNAEC